MARPVVTKGAFLVWDGSGWGLLMRVGYVGGRWGDRMRVMATDWSPFPPPTMVKSTGTPEAPPRTSEGRQAWPLFVQLWCMSPEQRAGGPQSWAWERWPLAWLGWRPTAGSDPRGSLGLSLGPPPTEDHGVLAVSQAFPPHCSKVALLCLSDCKSSMCSCPTLQHDRRSISVSVAALKS